MFKIKNRPKSDWLFRSIFYRCSNEVCLVERNCCGFSWRTRLIFSTFACRLISFSISLNFFSFSTSFLRSLIFFMLILLLRFEMTRTDSMLTPCFMALVTLSRYLASARIADFCSSVIQYFLLDNLVSLFNDRLLLMTNDFFTESSCAIWLFVFPSPIIRLTSCVCSSVK